MNYSIDLRPNHYRRAVNCRCCNVEIESGELLVYTNCARHTPVKFCIPCAKSIGELVAGKPEDVIPG